MLDLKQFNPLKILSHQKVISAILDGQNPPPVTCGFDPSNFCNHNCVWCMYRNYKSRENKIMPASIMFQTIRELGKAGVKSITFTGGGEPLLHPSINEGLYKTQEAGMEMGLITNGGVMQDSCKAIVDTCTFLRISLDAAIAETHTSVHEPKNWFEDNFDRIIENIKTVIDLRQEMNKNLAVGISFLIHPLNYTEIYGATILAKSLGVDYIQIRPALPWTGKELEKTSIWSVIQELIEKSQALEDNQFRVFSILHKFDKTARTERTYIKCLGHNFASIIGADCNVYLCCQFRGDSEFSFGNLKEKSFSEVWESKERQEVIKRINLKRCPSCRYDEYNKILDYLNMAEKCHRNFL